MRFIFPRTAAFSVVLVCALPACAGFLPLLMVPTLACADELTAVTTPATVPATTAELPMVTVTARADAVATSPSLEEARDAQQAIAGGASVIDAASYKEGRVSTPADALRYAAGVFTASRFGSEESRVSIRGSGLQRTFHGRGIMFLQDGAALNLADGSGDFQAVEPLSTRYTEVFRGANALQYGAATLGGAINFVSPTGRDAVPEIRLEAGSFGYERAYAQYAAAGEKADVFISGSHYGREGFQEHSEQNTQRFFANSGYRLSDTLEQRIYFAVVQTDSELPGSLTQNEMRAGDVRKAAPGNVTNDQKRDFDLYRVAYKLNWLPAEAQKVEFSTFYSVKSLFHPIFQVLEQDSDDYGIDLRWTHGAPFSRAADRFVLGARAARGDTDDNRFVNAGGQAAARTDQSEQLAQSTDVYTEYTLGFAPAWSLVAGAQWLTAERKFTDLFFSAPADPDKSFSKDYEHVVPRLGVIHDITDSVQLFANVSGLYEPPSFGELSGGPGVTQLDAQEGTSYEIGTRGSMRGAVTLDWDVAIYQANLDNELLAFQVSPSATRTVNADKTLHCGVEASASLEFLTHWQARLSYQRNDFMYDDDAVYGNNEIAGVPRQGFNGELTFRFLDNKAYVGPTMTAASSSWVDHLNKVKAAGYAIYGLKVGQQVTPAFSWFLEGRNLTDKVYAATTGVVVDATTLSFGQPQRLFNPGDGRAWYAGVDWAFN